MNTTDREVIIKLTEHDASRLLDLIRKRISQDNKIWQSYWERLANNVEQSIEHAGQTQASPVTDRSWF